MPAHAQVHRGSYWSVDDGGLSLFGRRPTEDSVLPEVPLSRLEDELTAVRQHAEWTTWRVHGMHIEPDVAFSLWRQGELNLDQLRAAEVRLSGRSTMVLLIPGYFHGAWDLCIVPETSFDGFEAFVSDDPHGYSVLRIEGGEVQGRR